MAYTDWETVCCYSIPFIQYGEGLTESLRAGDAVMKSILTEDQMARLLGPTEESP